MKEDDKNLKPNSKNSSYYFLLSKFFCAILLSTFYFLFSNSVEAAQFSITSDSVNVRTGDAVTAAVLLDTQDKNINAIDGKILFPGNIFEITKISDGNSVINLWVEKPHLSGPGEIYFSGIVSGGYAGSAGKLFSVEFRARQSGEGSIKISEARAFLNDGLATQDAVAVSAGLILRASSAFPTSENKTIADREPPESFVPEIGRDTNLFGGKYFLVFAATDKGSGISHYEIMELSLSGREPRGKWRAAESPHVLNDQSLKSDIYVRAVDLAGNFIIAEVPAPYGSMGSYGFWLKALIAALAILIVLLLIIWIVARRSLH